MTEFNIDTQSLLQRFLDYVQIDSESGQEKEIADRLVKDFKDLGLDVTTDQAGTLSNSTGYNIYATLKGDSTLEPILFCAHMDTVTPGLGVKPHVEDGFVKTDGTTILGADDKTGIVAIMEAVNTAKSLEKRPTVEVVITIQEETGMHGAKNLDYSRILSKQVLILDSCDPPNEIISAAPGQNKIQATIQGKRSHAGVAPESGISAIAVGAAAVSKMNLFRIDEETTCNIGTFSAVGPTNIISPEAFLEFEIRSRNETKLAEQTEHILSILKTTCDEYAATLHLETEKSYQGFHLPDDHPFVQRVMGGIRAIGLDPKTVATGGGSDANVFNAKGIPSLNIGIGSMFVHTTKEQQNIHHMNQVSQICYEIIKNS